MKTFILKVCVTICLLLILTSNGSSQTRNQIFVGARPLGLGETFTAIADDGNTVYWNQAGLPTLKRIELNSMYTNLYNIPGLQNLFLSLVYPLSPRYSIGAGWFHCGFDDDELEFFRDKGNLSFGARTFGSLFLGANVKYLNTDARLDGVSEGKADGFGFDVGALYLFPFKKFNFLKQINIGVMAHDIGGTKITYAGTNKSEAILPQNIRFGLTLLAKEELSLFKWLNLKNTLLAFDFDDRFHVGAETWVFNILGLRAGFQKDFYTAEAATYSFGLSLKFPYISTQMDYAFISPPTLPASSVFSFSFAASQSPVKILEINVDDLYASFYKTYAMTMIGHIKIRNDYDEELKMTMNVSIPGLTESAVQETFVLLPNEKRKLHFPAIFSKNILNVKDLEFRQVKVKIEYNIKKEAKYVEAFKKFRLFGRGAITWENPGKAVAFITKLDQMVKLFAIEAIKDVPYLPDDELGKVYVAEALFRAMGTYGIKYKEDTDNPFSIIPKSQSMVDHIKYPAELLKSKQGDCDDLTVLYASLLEYCGIKTALVSMSDHITIMFDTGIHERKWWVLGVGDTLAIAKNKSLWLPIEVTKVGSSFWKAWHDGGKIYRESEHNEDFKVVFVCDVEGIYLSALPEDLQTPLAEFPDMEEQKKIVTDDIAQIKHKKTGSIKAHYLTELQQSPANDSLRNRLGIILVQQDSIDGATAQFSKTLDRQPENIQALINLANVYCISGRFNDAKNNYLKAAKFLKNEPGIYLNLAIMYQLWKINNPGDSTRFQSESEKNLLHAFKLLEGNEIKAFDLLGIPEEEIEVGDKADFKTWIKKQAAAIIKFIKRSTQQYLTNKSVRGARIERKAVKLGVDKDRSYILWWAN